jgi:hypothetical protein
VFALSIGCADSDSDAGTYTVTHLAADRVTYITTNAPSHQGPDASTQIHEKASTNSISFLTPYKHCNCVTQCRPFGYFFFH